jgi:polyhydroxyalkanoate synthesis regulator phasin
MNFDDINTQLAMLVNSTDQEFSAAASQVQSLTQQVQAGQMSSEEFKELLGDLQRQLAIIQDSERLQFKEVLNTCINGIITIISNI